MKAGIPDLETYRGLPGSGEFGEMDRFASSFLDAHRGAFRWYSWRWCMDPLHYWSRQWEYPFVWDRLRGFLSRGGGRRLRVLDAGSGITFFPFFLESRYADLDVVCCDYSNWLAGSYRRVNAARGSHVEFVAADMRSIPCRSASLDAIYCISVLEHTVSYEEIIDEFRRLLRPGGLLVVTFDVSIDGRHVIPLDGAERLLEALSQRFQVREDAGGGVREQCLGSGILKRQKYSGPAQRVKWMLRLKRPPLLTVFCTSYLAA